LQRKQTRLQSSHKFSTLATTKYAHKLEDLRKRSNLFHARRSLLLQTIAFCMKNYKNSFLLYHRR